MTKNLYERHPSAFSQYPPRPFTATQSTVAISGGYVGIQSLSMIHEAAASQAQFSIGCSSRDVSNQVRSQPLTHFGGMGCRFPRSCLESLRANQTSRTIPRESSSRHYQLAQLSTRPNYLDPHFDNRNWGLERNKGPLLPRLLDAGMRPGTPVDVDKIRKLFEQSTMHHNHYGLEIPSFLPKV